MRKPTFPTFILAAAIFGGPAAAQPPQRADSQRQDPQLFRNLVACRALSDATARLACFDATSAAMENATQSKDLVIVDRAQVRATRRGLFGLNLPSLPIFGGGDDDDKDEVKSIESVAASASQDTNGRWIVRLQEGGTWTQTDSSPLGRRPRAGSKVVVNRAAMGSYMMRIDGQPGIRARRVN
jgi:hypothetical protein